MTANLDAHDGVAEAALWGIARYSAADGAPVLLPLSEADVEADTLAAVTRLRAFGIGTDDAILVVSLMQDAAQMAPFQYAVRRLGGTVCLADASPFDAYRTAAIVSQWHPRLVIGLDAGVVSGLEQLGHDVAELLGSVPAVLALPSAWPRLTELGVPYRRLFPLGPAVAAECPDGAGAHVDAAVWQVRADDGEILLSSAAPRAHTVTDLATGTRGEVATGRCGCGSDDPRVLPA